jgi:hypothetical protein
MGKFILWLLILFVVGYAIYFGVHWIIVRLDYSSMESEAQKLFSPTSNCSYEEIPDRLMKKAEEQNVPLKEDDIKLYIDEWNGYRVLSFGYVDSIPIFKFTAVRFKFSFVDTVFYNSQ